MLTGRQYRTLAIATFLLAMALVTLRPVRAWADLGEQPTGGGQKHGDGSVGVTAGNDNNSPGGNVLTGGTGKSGGGSSPCQWTYMGNNNNTFSGTFGGYTGTGPDGGGTFIPPGTQGTWFLKSCPGQVPVSVFVPAGQPAPAPVSPQQLAVEAQNQLTPGAPVVQMSPPSTSSTAWQYTNLPTWVWVAPAQWKTLHAT
ncbi:MAG: hypothetical protein QOF30_1835, partial [Acidimicrobiaceae bacterium]|nr:hypothetical protein [Acidimicrobiaceae bacterium]